MPRRAVSVIGAGSCDTATYERAREVGRLLAERGFVVVTGGRSGVMEAASRGARDAGGLCVGILPDLDPASANDAVEIAIPTGMGQLRNGLVVSAGEAVIAVGGAWGTLSEIGLALKMGKRVIGLDTWEIARHGVPRDGILCASDPAEAVRWACGTQE